MSEDRNRGSRGNRYQRGNRAPYRGQRSNRSESSEPRNVGAGWRAPVRGRYNGSRGTRGARGGVRSGSEQRANGEQRNHNNQVMADDEVSGTGSWRGRGAPSHHQVRNRTLNPYKLKNMAQTPPEDLVGEIMLDKSGFPQALNNESLYSKFEVFQDIILIILKAIDFDAKPRESIVLLSKFKSSSLLSCGFPSYYSKLLGRREPFSSVATKASFAGSINLLKLIVEKFPTFIEKVLPPYSMAKLIISQGNDFDEDIKQDFEHLKIITESAMKQHSEVDRHKSRRDYPPPPDNFRDLGIFPNFSRDLACLQEPYLRPIETEGGFQDVEHYLDVHFRLLREDFIQPLRIGIREYLKISENRLTIKKLTEVRIYKDVKIIKPVCTNSGLSHEIRFSVENLKRVNWQTSKRFIYGSLICLSNNNFEDIIMATVEDRKPDFLAKGILRIKFEDDIQLHNYNGTETFIMLETTAFFEPYRHVLDGLITINPETFPFQDAIIQCHPMSNPPKYLNNLGAKFYDLTCLSTKKTSDEIVISDEPEPIAPRRLKLVDILRESSWPSASCLGLDESQSEALRNSLTSEVSVVQGPPGTGKTFLGLKIVEILLENWERWNADEKPILVVCYTNHALDQFLEGISKFLTKGIVRVGGRSKSELMKAFSLNQLRYQLRSIKNIPKDIYSKKKDVLREMQSLKEEIERAGITLESLEKNLMNENLLRKFMTPEQFTSLTSFQSPFYNNTSFMMEWLHMNEVFEEPADEMADGPQSPEDEEQEYVDIKNEAELEEQQRRLEEDDLIFGLHNLTLEERWMNHLRATEMKFNVNKQKLGGGSEWHMQKEQIRNMKKNLKKHLSNNDVMGQHEGEAVINVWQLNVYNRWRLYRYWLQKYRINLKLGVATEMQTYNLLAENLKEIQSNEDEWVMKGAKIIGMTTTGAARYRNLLSSIRPKVIIVEEAAEVLESHVITSLNPECQHLILIGDHKQLRPSANVYKLGTKYHLNCSLFERLVMNSFPYVTLERQHRMRPEIADFARIIYPDLKDDVSVLNRDHVMGVNSNVFFLNHCEQETQDSELMSASNKHEAAFLAKFCLYLIQQGYSKQQITILTPYAGQMFEIRKLMPKKTFEGLRICPVDNYQGEENDIVLLSLVRSNFDENIGFLKETNRLNVALTRAKKGLFVIGNFEMFKNKSEFMHRIYSVAVQKEPPVIGNHLTLCCQNHPNVKIQVSCAKDFDHAPEGGCTQPCRFRLSCGHTCTRSCHPYDKEHSQFFCLKPCQKVFQSCQHNCQRKCSEKCGKCEIKVKKVIPRCKHEQEMMCHQAPERFVCRAKCDYVLPCNHPCTKPCGEEHAECYVRLPKTLDCGHRVNIPCYRFNDDDVECNAKCRQLLKCGHFCEGTCGKCFRGRIHVRCSKKCDRNLICGHRCRSLCSDVCPPCRLPCENKCSHNDCKKECGQPCNPCNEVCSWNCRHHACNQLCHVECDRTPCDAPCEKRLRCGHPCVGLCGEICPSLCRICQVGELTEIFFGTEQDEGARFIQLMDCPHFIEVRALDNWVSGIFESPSVVPLCCPKCRTPIQTSDRYRREIKSIRSKMEKVKAKICGDKNDLESKKVKILATLEDMGSWASSVIDAVTGNIGLYQMTIIEGAVELLHHLNDFQSNSYAQKLKLRMMKDIRLLSMQECEEIQFEISRLELLKMFKGCRQKVENSLGSPKFSESHRKAFEQALHELTTCKLDDDKENTFRNLFREMNSLLTGLGITEKERIQILTAMRDIHRGAWFECPNGHVYAIGDCGGATQESKCNECGAAIGGASHALRRDNRWNRAMDGSDRTAWPGTAMNPGGV